MFKDTKGTLAFAFKRILLCTLVLSTTATVPFITILVDSSVTNVTATTVTTAFSVMMTCVTATRMMMTTCIHR